MVDKPSPHTPTPNCQTLTTHVSLKCQNPPSPFIVFIAAPLSFINTHIFILFLLKKKKEKRKTKRKHGKTVG